MGVFKLVCLTLLLSICNAQRLLGGQNPVNLQDARELEKIKSIATYAVSEIQGHRLRNSNDRTKLQLIRIVSAAQQVVSGINYFIQLRIKDSNCRTRCSVETCHVQVYDQAWTNTRRLEKHECTSERPRHLQLLGGGGASAGAGAGSHGGHIGGGSQHIANEQELVKLALNEANEVLNSYNYYKLIRSTQSALSPQRVAVEIEIGETNCPRSDERAMNCPETGNRKQCQVVINTSSPRPTPERISC